MIENKIGISNRQDKVRLSATIYVAATGAADTGTRRPKHVMMQVETSTTDIFRHKKSIIYGLLHCYIYRLLLARLGSKFFGVCLIIIIFYCCCR
jgi:hypothetical protein